MLLAEKSLGAIRAMTITAPDVTAASDAWTGFMDYRLVHRGQVSEAEAASWNAPAIAGKPTAILEPASGEPTYIRFVEQATPTGYEPQGTYGWNTTELTVQNSDALFERLKDSPFETGGPPHTVPTYEYLRAMQAVGVAGERLNLCWITEVRPDLAVAQSFVGRCFIAVMSTPDLPATLAFYEDTFGNPPSPIRDLPRFQLAVVTLADGCKLEIDQYPHPQKTRLRPTGGLPPGIAMVSFECSNVAQLQDRFIGPATVSTLPAFHGRRTGVMTGSVGEMIELLDV